MTGNRKVSEPARRRRGVTLIEAVLYIAISLALIVGGLVFYEQASVQSRTHYIARTYAALLAEARVLAAEVNTASMSNLQNLLYIRGSVPEDLWDATQPPVQRLRFPFSGMWTTMDASYDWTGKYGIALRIWEIDVRACSRLAPTTPGGRSIFADGFTWGSMRDENPPQTITFWSKGSNFTPALAATACKAADLNNNGKVMIEPGLFTEI